MKMTAFGDTASCSLTDIDRRFTVRTTSIIRVCTSETSVYNEATWRNIAKGCHVLGQSLSFIHDSLEQLAGVRENVCDS
jgi:hypothetical protein